MFWRKIWEFWWLREFPECGCVWLLGCPLLGINVCAADDDRPFPLLNDGDNCGREISVKVNIIWNQLQREKCTIQSKLILTNMRFWPNFVSCLILEIQVGLFLLTNITYLPCEPRVTLTNIASLWIHTGSVYTWMAATFYCLNNNQPCIAKQTLNAKKCNFVS